MVRSPVCRAANVCGNPRPWRFLCLVPGGGVEPPRAEARRILSPLRLPVPPSRLDTARAATEGLPRSVSDCFRIAKAISAATCMMLCPETPKFCGEYGLFRCGEPLIRDQFASASAEPKGAHDRERCYAAPTRANFQAGSTRPDAMWQSCAQLAHSQSQ